MKQARLKAHLKAAYAYSELSHAQRLKVGAVLIKDDRIISIGINGMPSGGSNNCENIVGTTKTKPYEPIYETKPEVIHAEQNVIAFAAKNGLSTNDCSLISTDSPCYECAKLLIQAGIKEVYYDRPYRDTEPLDLLTRHKITVKKVFYED